MSEPPIEFTAPATLDELLLIIPNKFNLVMVAAKRARQIKDGAPRLVVSESVNPVTVALEEIVAGKIVMEDGRARVLDEMGRALPAETQSYAEDLLALPDENDRPGLAELLGLADLSDLDDDIVDESEE